MAKQDTRTDEISDLFKRELNTEEVPQYQTEVDGKTVIATDERLLVPNETGVGSIAYSEIVSVKPTTKFKKSGKFWGGIILLFLSLPGLLQGSTGALFLTLPLSLILLFLWYRQSKVVEIDTHDRGTISLKFPDAKEAARSIDSLVHQAR